MIRVRGLIAPKILIFMEMAVSKNKQTTTNRNCIIKTKKLCLKRRTQSAVLCPVNKIRVNLETKYSLMTLTGTVSGNSWGGFQTAMG